MCVINCVFYKENFYLKEKEYKLVAEKITEFFIKFQTTTEELYKFIIELKMNLENQMKMTDFNYPFFQG